MSDYTSKLNLYKVDPAIDGEDTFNIKSMMNDNWDKIDEKVGNMDEKLSCVEDNANNYNHPDTHDADMIRIKDEGGKFTGDNVEDALGEVGSQLADMANVIVATGTGTAITLSMTSVTAYSVNMKLTFIASANNSSEATTIDINGLGAKNLYKPNTTTAPNLKNGKPYTVWYNGTNFFLQASAEGNTLAEHVLAGKTFSNDDDIGIVGTMDLSNLISGNIKQGININGIVGNLRDMKIAYGTLTTKYYKVGIRNYIRGLDFIPYVIYASRSKNTCIVVENSLYIDISMSGGIFWYDKVIIGAGEGLYIEFENIHNGGFDLLAVTSYDNPGPTYESEVAWIAIGK